MPWKCPACHSQIVHSEVESKPRANTPYRCHICRLELVLDSESDHLVVAAMREDNEQKVRT